MSTLLSNPVVPLPPTVAVTGDFPSPFPAGESEQGRLIGVLLWWADGKKGTWAGGAEKASVVRGAGRTQPQDAAS